MKDKDRKGSARARRAASASPPGHVPADLEFPRAMRFAQLLIARAREELENWGGPAATKRELHTQAEMFRIAFGNLGQQLTPIWQQMSAWDRRQLELTIQALISSSHSIGEYVQVSPERIEIDAINQARAARKALAKARAQVPAEKVLMRTIRAAHRRGPLRHPWKEAVAMEPKVNEKLEAAGHERVKVSVIYRRLKALGTGSRS